MDNLCAYIASIKGEATEPVIVCRTSRDNSYTDQDLTVDSQESVFSFSNGVVVKYSTESDQDDSDERLCPECWISYEVLSEPAGLQVRPRHKTFISHCQELFWLKINKQHFSRS